MATLEKYNECKVQSIGKARLILDCFYDKKEIGLTELSKKLGMNKSTVFALADSLKTIGFLDQISDNGKYTLGLGLLQLSSRISIDLKRIARPYMERLSEEYLENVNLTGFQGTEITYIDQIESLYPVRVAGNIGNRMELNSSAVGKAILAVLPDEKVQELIHKMPFTAFTANTITDDEELLKELKLIRQRGYGINNEESREDVYTVGVALLNSDGYPIGGLSVDGPVGRMDPEHKALEIANKLMRYAGEIQRML